MQHDVVIVGGAFAGLAAATYLARARRRVCIIDARRPRNRFADASHGFLGFDGVDPQSILTKARGQVARYPGVTMIEAEATEARTFPDGFAVSLASGEEVSARKAILAFGLRDTLEPIPGLQERWGKTVLHCPYCHGLEFAGRRLGVLFRTPMSAHQACLVAEWGPTTLFLNGGQLDLESAERLAKHGVSVEAGRLARLVGENAGLSAVEFEDGRTRPVEALYVAPQSCMASPIAEQLGAAIDEGPLGPVIRTDADKMTTVPGLYAAGDIARAPHAVSWAVADGVTAGTAAHRTLVFG
ncbi:NAD(P)/FAD-dependent oxidoreductase [Sphingomonas sp. IC4-52]|uniref:NAD(P)/FAD-dependent oxidoreductase n=1 Tax=Sphingomonas sp. IC4-52 TaxID=2887202 RepID=UPI001D1266B1|nr:NAD(P)/FAD-dependent oxidoreductase [Sphingomonas sp. IC4-52]MCC2980936.1 NAD(P)/FAD-dependent oxidoreductase [Sphingomonas sp. IC4-52]